jgi:hypothetical protein
MCVLNYSCNTLKYHLGELFVRFGSPEYSVNDLRHIYIIYLKDNNLLEYSPEQHHISYQMGHSVSTQQDYLKKVDLSSVPEVDVVVNEKQCRKSKYSSDEERREAKLSQTRAWNERERLRKHGNDIL